MEKTTMTSKTSPTTTNEMTSETPMTTMAPKTSTSQTKKLMLLYTNDIHGRFEQMPKLASAFRHARREFADYATLKLDVGDHMDRARLLTEGTGGRANVAVMNATGYDFVTLGNNEGLTFTPQILAGLYGEQAQFQVLGSNIFELDGPTPAFLREYAMVERGGLRIGLIGVTPLTKQYRKFYNMLGWDVREPEPIVTELVRQLRESGEVDVIVLLSHLGIKADERMAETIDGIDVILGGHSHHYFAEPHKIGGTYLCATGEFGEYAGVLLLDFDEAAGKVAEVRGWCLPVGELEDDPEVASVIAEYGREAHQELGKTEITLSRSYGLSWSGESELGNLLAAGLREWADAEIGLVNAGQLTDGIEAGAVSKERLIEVCPSLIHPCRALLAGRHIREALEEALLDRVISRKVGGFGNRGKVLGTLCVDGLVVRYDPRREEGDRIVGIDVGGGPLDPGREYVVGMISYFTVGKAYPSLAQCRDSRDYVPFILRDVLLKQLRKCEAKSEGAEPGSCEGMGTDESKVGDEHEATLHECRRWIDVSR
jgi:2',3'-cyclic-nucleotide 2'-phosphodiesterase (5'-nucleotidase family)